MSITSRINEMSSHIEQAYDELQGLGADLTNVNKNIENISMVLDDIYDSMPQVSGEGTSLTLDDTRVGKIKSTLKGNTSQTGTPTPTSPIPVNVVSGDNEINVCGKNLLDSSTFSLKTYGGANNSTRCSQSQAVPLKAGKYVFTTNLDLSVYDYKCDVLTEPPQTVSTETYIINSGFITNINTWTLNLTQAQEGYLGILIRKKDNTNLDLETIKGFQFQLEKTSATTYEPYQGNTYNIDLPVENLFDKSTATLNKGVSSSTGNLYNSSDSFATDYIPIQNGKSYTMNSYSSSNVCFGALYDSSKAFLEGFTTSQDNKTVTINNANAKYIRITGQKVNIDTYQLEKGSKQNSYTPYGTTPIELCKIENYQDYFYKDSGKWYLHKEIGKVVLNGSESWSKSGTYTGNYYCQNIVPYALGNTPSSMICNLTNIFIGIATQLPDNDNCILLEGANVNKTIDFKISSISTLDDFKSFLGNTNLILYYVYATPTNEEITYQPLIDQLNLLEKAISKDGQTNISQVNNDLPFIISASALKEWQENTSLNSTLSMVNPLSLGNTLNTQENDIQPIEVDNIEPLEEEENEES